MEQRVAIKFCVRVKNADIETFGIRTLRALMNAYLEEWLKKIGRKNLA
jgi:hypothetical protein